LLKSLSIKNYALIEELNVKFDKGFSILTGETGAGKSILLGALGLVLGKRADVSFLKQKELKCIVEAEFLLNQYGLEKFFAEEDLDFEPITIIRREIMPSGKSRAFINDTPTTLNVLNALSAKLIDVHSQHKTLALSDKKFQFNMIDALASNVKEIESYQRGLQLFKKLTKELEDLLTVQKADTDKYEYNLFLFNELNDAALKVGEQEEIESSLVLMNNVEFIKLNLTEALQIVENEEYGIINLIQLFKSKLEGISNLSEAYELLASRIESISIEAKDILQEIESENERVEYNPVEIERLNDRLQRIYDLLKKNSVSTIADLLMVHEELAVKVDAVKNSSRVINDKEKEIKKVSDALNSLALIIHEKRKKAIPKLTKKLENKLSNLGMENTRFVFKLIETDLFLSNGKDELELLFSANKGENYSSLKKAASGGEMSRIMLAVKAILSNYIKLPTIIFDEIDTGVSGEISNRMGDVMLQMSSNMQVMSITHLPQIAGIGDQHYKVYKEEVSGKIKTQLRLLNEDERIIEIAEMLGGKELTPSALAHAKALLN
jgi:DNA repair protein RecN (Recombination protein N)